MAEQHVVVSFHLGKKRKWYAGELTADPAPAANPDDVTIAVKFKDGDALTGNDERSNVNKKYVARITAAQYASAPVNGTFALPAGAVTFAAPPPPAPEAPPPPAPEAPEAPPPPEPEAPPPPAPEAPEAPPPPEPEAPEAPEAPAPEPKAPAEAPPPPAPVVAEPPEEPHVSRHRLYIATASHHQNRREFPVSPETVQFLDGGRDNPAAKRAQGVPVTLHFGIAGEYVCHVRRRKRTGTNTPVYELVQSDARLMSREVNAEANLHLTHAEFAPREAAHAYDVRLV